jgi:hypothetical protein
MSIELTDEQRSILALLGLGISIVGTFISLFLAFNDGLRSREQK